MNKTIAIYLGELLAYYADIEGMKAANIEREGRGNVLAYGDAEFAAKEREIQDTINELRRQDF